MTSGHPIILANSAGVRFSATTAPRGTYRRQPTYTKGEQLLC
jgi:hypothetical protein